MRYFAPVCRGRLDGGGRRILEGLDEQNIKCVCPSRHAEDNSCKQVLVFATSLGALATPHVVKALSGMMGHMHLAIGRFAPSLDVRKSGRMRPMMGTRTSTPSR